MGGWWVAEWMNVMCVERCKCSVEKLADQAAVDLRVVALVIRAVCIGVRMYMCLYARRNGK